MRNKIFVFLVFLVCFFVFVPSVKACTFDWEDRGTDENGDHWYKLFLIDELNPTNRYVYKITWDESNTVTFETAQDNNGFSEYKIDLYSELHYMLIDSVGSLPNNNNPGHSQYYTNVSLKITGDPGLLDFSAYEGEGNFCTNLHTPTPTSTPTPTPSPSPAPTGTPNSCGGTCGSNSNCKSELVCYSGYCRNPNCTSGTDCNCPGINPTPTPTKTPSPTKTPIPTPTQEPNPTESPEVLGAETVQTEPSISPEPVPSVSSNKNIIIAGILIGSGITLIGTSIYLNLKAEKSSKLQNDI